LNGNLASACFFMVTPAMCEGRNFDEKNTENLFF